MPRTAHVHLTVAAKLLGCSLAQASRRAAAGKLGPLHREGIRVLVEVAAIERYLGRRLDLAAINNAENPEPSWSALRLTLDPGTVSSIVESRDDEWRLHLDRLGIELEQSPAMPTMAAPLVDAQWFFTRRQVEDLLASALAQRDSQWRAFNLNGHVYKAQRPNGPAALDLSSVSMSEET